MRCFQLCQWLLLVFLLQQTTQENSPDDPNWNTVVRVKRNVTAGGNSTTNVNTTMATDPPTMMPNITEVQTTPTTVTQEVNTTVTTPEATVNTTVLPNGIPGVQENSTTEAPPTTPTTVTEPTTTVTQPTVAANTTVEEKTNTNVTQTPETSTVTVPQTPNPQPPSTGAPAKTTVPQTLEPSTAAPTKFNPITNPQPTQKPDPQHPNTPQNPLKPTPESSRNLENSKNSTGQNSYAEALQDEESEKHDKKLKEQHFKKKIFAFELGTCSMLIVASVAAYVFSFLAYDYAKNLTKVIKQPGKKLKKK
ncbi:hypothetical protein L5515_003246 [Caenorhabditis briggsae]|uniref:Uncharacterized protein n=2 Tax=Caenorhabditis briggsae TaxID=6238 RepID=A0AAE9JAK5_CAEBR|nr:hypothetical protein L5515_003246 [Caenorhabditis briggsae]